MATVLFMGSTTINASVLETKSNSVDEEFGCASNCNRKTRNLVSAMADFANVNPNVFVESGFYVQMYTQCYENECN